MSQTELAEAAGVSRATISHMESGAVERPHLGGLARVASVLGLSISDLISGSVEQPSLEEIEAAVARKGQYVAESSRAYPLRDWFAGQALAQLASGGWASGPTDTKKVAVRCYRIADAMIAAREEA